MTSLRPPGTVRTRRRPALYALAAAVAVGLAGVAPAAHAEEPTVYYVDCDATTSAGTSAAPFSTLEQANAVDLKPGDSVLFKRGTTCRGTYAPKGTWDAAAPMTFGPYGDGSARPVIDGDGKPDAIRIENLGGFRLSGLEVTNAKQKGTRAKARGVLVVGNNYDGVLKDVQVSGMYVHDVWGDDTKDGNGSGGITVAVIGNDKPSRFDGVLIEGNTVEHVDRTGITAVPSTWSARPEEGNYVPERPFAGNTGIVIRANTVKDTGGDGIVVQTGVGTLVEHNSVDGFQKRSDGYNAGIWVWNSDGTTFRYNEASGGKTHRDGMAFDVDQGSNDTLYEYNYSHDNEGGFFLLCNAEGRIKNAVIRYNISQNDAFRGVETCNNTVESAHMYNNTIYIGPGVSQTVINENNTKARNIRFENNIVVKEGAGSAGFTLRSGKVSLTSNQTFGVEVPSTAQGGAMVDPRLMAPGKATSIDDLDGYKLHASSPALHAGALVAGNGGKDFFGNPVSATSAPSVGAHEGPGVEGPVPAPLDVPVPALTNGSFENGLSGWSSSSGGVVDDEAAPEGKKVAKLGVDKEDAVATVEQTVSGLIPGMTYRIAGWTRTEGGTAVVGIKGAGNADLKVTGSEWTPVSAEFVASQKTATVFCYRDTVGTGWCDDLRILAGPAKPPTVTASLSAKPAASGWYTTTPKVTVDAVAPDGLYRTWYLLDADNEAAKNAPEWTRYSEPFALEDGEHHVLARAQDRTGVTGETPKELRVRVDTVAPRITTDIDTSARTARVSAVDTTSGLAKLEYSVDGGATFAQVSGPVSLGRSTALEVRATDKAGLVATGHWTISDQATPTVTPSPSSSGTTGSTGDLPWTGFNAGAVAGLAALALVAGGLATWAGFRRRRA